MLGIFDFTLLLIYLLPLLGLLLGAVPAMLVWYGYKHGQPAWFAALWQQLWPVLRCRLSGFSVR